jgi:phage regulator Rha-like protein
MTTNGITLQVTKNPGITIADFRADMVEKWQIMTAKTGGTLFGKAFIPFGKEGDI